METLKDFRMHFEVGHVLRSRALSEDEFNGDGPVRIFDLSNVLRLAHNFSPKLQETDLRILEKACRYAHRSEEFFLINVNARCEWLRTEIGHARIDGAMTYWTNAESNEFDSDIIIHSNILPYEPYWSKVKEWSGTGMECKIGICQSEEGARIVMNAADGNDKHKRRLAKGDAQGVWQITLKGGQFIGKTGNEESIKAELRILNQLKAHPHIIYFFYHPCDEARELCEETICVDCEDAREAGVETTQLCQACAESKISAYFMEYMASDLKSFIFERMRMDGDKPPFEPEDAVDILLQIAKAMKHIHDKEVVHCDVKSDNILICEIPTQNEGKQYLVKVADFGSAQQICTADFIAGNGTDAYISPEALKQRTDRAFPIDIPSGIDVYSFGIVAFEVLTGDFKHFFDGCSCSIKVRKKFRAGVLDGARPPIRQFTKVIDEDLISLVENCWHETPSERPTFVTVCEALDGMRGAHQDVVERGGNSAKQGIDEGLLSLVEKCCHEIPSERPTLATVCEELDGMRGVQQDVVERGDNSAKQAKLSNGSASVCDQVVKEECALVHVGAGAKKASAISKAIQSAKDKVSILKRKKKKDR